MKMVNEEAKKLKPRNIGVNIAKIWGRVTSGTNPKEI